MSAESRNIDLLMELLALPFEPNPAEYLARNDAYHWFEPVGGLIKTGPTHTNVCDVRVVLVEKNDSAG